MRIRVKAPSPLLFFLTDSLALKSKVTGEVK